MNNQKNNVTPAFQKLYTNFFREMWMNLFQKTIKNLLIVLVNKYIDIPISNETENYCKGIALNTLNELMPLVTLLSTIKNFGIPKSLVFITETGQAIDLLEVKEIDQNEMFNQILDNLKSLNTTCNHE